MHKTHASWFLSLLLGLLCLAPPSQAEHSFSRLISPKELQQLQRGETSVRVLDVRTADYYSLGHVPGAVNLDAWLAFNRDNQFLLPPVEQLQKLLRAKGINNEDLIVIYDQGENFFAARILWALDVMGHENNRLMDGGFERWQAAGMPVSDSEEPRLPEGNFVPSVQPRILASKFVARLAMDNPNLLLVDVRPNEEYLGQANPDNNPRSGHIPGAINLPWQQNLQQSLASGPFKPENVLKSLYESRLPRDKKIITYCQVGGHSAMVYFILRELGYDVAVYDGSWQEWSRDLALPVETGSPQG